MPQIFGISRRSTRRGKTLLYLKGHGHTCSINANVKQLMSTGYSSIMQSKILKQFGTSVLHIMTTCCTKEPRPYLKGQGYTCSLNVNMQPFRVQDIVLLCMGIF